MSVNKIPPIQSESGTKRTRSPISPRPGVEGRPEVVGAVQNDELIRLESPESIAMFTNLAAVLPLMTETDSELQSLLPQ
jgi:hypothetical protein